MSYSLTVVVHLEHTMVSFNIIYFPRPCLSPVRSRLPLPALPLHLIFQYWWLGNLRSLSCAGLVVTVGVCIHTGAVRYGFVFVFLLCCGGKMICVHGLVTVITSDLSAPPHVSLSFFFPYCRCSGLSSSSALPGRELLTFSSTLDACKSTVGWDCGPNMLRQQKYTGYTKILLASEFSNQFSKVLPWGIATIWELENSGAAVAFSMRGGKVKCVFLCNWEQGILSLCWCWVSRFGHRDAFIVKDI